MILADKIMKLRKQNGWSQEELAEQMGISRQSVSKWENGTSIPDLDKIVRMSGLFGVSTDYLLKDEIEELTREEAVEIREEQGDRIISLDEANDFMDLTRKLAHKMALAVSLCILSPICLLLLGGMAEFGGGLITENMAGGIGTAVLLIVVAAGVAIMIFEGMKLSKYEYIEKEVISLAYGVQGIVEKRKDEFEETNRMCIAIGTVICIVGVVPLMVAAGINAGDFVCIVCVDILLFLVACGVYFFVWAGLIQGSYNKLLQLEDYTPEKKVAKQRTGFLTAAYWCIVVAIYLAVSFRSSSWRTSWVIWPVAGVLYAAFAGICGAIAVRKGGPAQRK